MPDDLTFCPFCGANQTNGESPDAKAEPNDTASIGTPTPLQPSQPSPQPQYPTVPQNPYQPPTRGTNSWIPVLIGCGIGALAVACLIFYLVDPLRLFSAGTENSEIVTDEVAAVPNTTTQTTPVEIEDEEELGYGNLNDDYLLPEGSTRYYTRSELEKLDSRVLWYARNEMYAKHGKGFRTGELKRYFESKPWYVELYTADEFDDMPEQLNQYEKANEDLMTQIEEERNSPYLH